MIPKKILKQTLALLMEKKANLPTFYHGKTTQFSCIGFIAIDFFPCLWTAKRQHVDQLLKPGLWWPFRGSGSNPRSWLYRGALAARFLGEARPEENPSDHKILATFQPTWKTLLQGAPQKPIAYWCPPKRSRKSSNNHQQDGPPSPIEIDGVLSWVDLSKCAFLKTPKKQGIVVFPSK